MIAPSRIHVASYSPVQQCWHVETLAEHVRQNGECLADGTLGQTAFCAVALVESHEAAHEVIRRIEAMQKPEGTKEDGWDDND